MLAFKARSRAIIAAAHILALNWFFTLFWYDIFVGSPLTWGYAVVDAATAAIFWRQSRTSVFALPLFYIHALFVLIYFAATLVELNEWLVYFVANRIFEIEVAYVIICSVFRIRRRAPAKAKGAL